LSGRVKIASPNSVLFFVQLLIEELSYFFSCKPNNFFLVYQKSCHHAVYAKYAQMLNTI
jgi:hypothetical protein